jgi:uncharacterized BrkB/YihY/UPF0761 family membrane protein
MVRGKLVDLVLVMVTGLLVLLVVVGSAVGTAVWAGVARTLGRLGLDTGWIEAIVTRGVSLVLATFVVMLLYRFVPVDRLRYGAAGAGALVAAVLLLGLSLASARIYDSTLQMSAIYGSLTTLFVFLYAVYLHACVLLLGAAVAAAWARWPERPAKAAGERAPVRLARRAARFVRRRPFTPTGR